MLVSVTAGRKDSLLPTDTCHFDTDSSQEVLLAGENSSMAINIVVDTNVL